MRAILIGHALLLALILGGCSIVSNPREYNLRLEGCKETTIVLRIEAEHADNTKQDTRPETKVDATIPLVPGM
jgi:hypothetical protein